MENLFKLHNSKCIMSFMTTSRESHATYWKTIQKCFYQQDQIYIKVILYHVPISFSISFVHMQTPTLNPIVTSQIIKSIDLTILNKASSFINQRVKHVLLQSWFHGKSLMAHLSDVHCLCWLLLLEPDVKIGVPNTQKQNFIAYRISST